jgi:serine/threonine protein kinase/Tol biopolymer transport system component
VARVPEIGQILSHYRIIEKLGQGGMGEVYRARDLKLDRDVAIKVLPKALAQDSEALARFQREAKAVASLSHPNILAIHEFGTEQGLSFAAMELLEGVTLREKISSGPLSVRKALEYAVQITHGLASAHDRGVSHRDLKPENIFVTSSGIVKILDFGLAKQHPVSPPDDSSKSPTVDTDPLTVLGTIGYMAPEQVQGQPADRRSDIFSLGCVLYEMLTGKRAFARPTAAETMVAVLKEDPPPLDAPGTSGSFASTVTPGLVGIVGHCLEKDANERFQSARDLAFALQSLLNIPSGAFSPAAGGHRSRTSVLLVTGGLVVGATLLAFWAGDRFAVRRSESLRTPRFYVKQLTFEPGVEQDPCLSPDGQSFIFAAGKRGNLDIFLQRVGGQNTTNLTTNCDKDDHDPAFSPTGDRIAYRSECGGGGIYMMGATGESPIPLADFGFAPSWSPDGRKIVVATDHRSDPLGGQAQSQLWEIDVQTHAKRLLFNGDAVKPSWSPHGNRIAYWRLFPAGQRDILTVAAGASAGEPVFVTNDADDDWSPVWSPDGKYLYFGSARGGSYNLWRVAIEESTGKTQGLPEPVILPTPWCGQFSFSHDGSRLLFRTRASTYTLYKVGFDPQAKRTLGQPVTVLGTSLGQFAPDISIDGKLIVFNNYGSKEDLFIMREDGTNLRQLTDDPDRDRVPRFSPDGERIAFYSNRSGKYEIWTIRPDGSKLQQLTNNISGEVWYPNWSPTEKAIVYPDGIDNYRVEYDESFKEIRHQTLPRPEGEPPFVTLSWSGNGQFLAGGFWPPGNTDGGIGIYSFATKRFERFTRSGSSPRWLSVSDSRHLLYLEKGSLWCYDIEKKSQHIVIDSKDVPPILNFAVSRDGRVIYYEREQSEGDIWLATLR